MALLIYLPCLVVVCIGCLVLRESHAWYQLGTRWRRALNEPEPLHESYGMSAFLLLLGSCVVAIGIISFWSVGA